MTWVFNAKIMDKFILGLDVLCTQKVSVGLGNHMLLLVSEGDHHAHPFK
jgi:hypothetical protein